MSPKSWNLFGYAALLIALFIDIFTDTPNIEFMGLWIIGAICFATSDILRKLDE